MAFPAFRSTTPGAEDRVHAVEALLDANERALIGYASRLLGGDVDRGRDVVQDVFLRLCQQESLDGLGREWLFTVTRNRCIDVHRKESRMTSLENQDHGAARGLAMASPGQPADSTSAGGLGVQVDLVRALDRLPERQQEALRLKFESGLSYAEIGRIMDTSAGTVGWLLHTAIQGLKARMAPEGGAR